MHQYSEISPHYTSENGLKKREQHCVENIVFANKSKSLILLYCEFVYRTGQVFGKLLYFEK